MVHPTVLTCQARTNEAARKYEKKDAALAASSSEVMIILATSREAIVRSREVLDRLKARNDE
jgi:hypothetical protein